MTDKQKELIKVLYKRGAGDRYTRSPILITVIASDLGIKKTTAKERCMAAKRAGLIEVERMFDYVGAPYRFKLLEPALEVLKENT